MAAQRSGARPTRFSASRNQGNPAFSRAMAVAVVQLLSRYAIGQLPGESLAETVARVAGISAWELKDLLWERAHATGP